jgi:putative salt-induced outer membrane protein YdiY
VPRAAANSPQLGPAGTNPDVTKQDGAAGVTLEEKKTWYERAFLIVPEPWDTGIELGINGSSGTSDSFSMRTGGYIKRQSRFSKLDTSAYYNRTGSGGVLTQNNAQFDVRNDWLLDEKSPWTLFATNSVFYDQFKDFDVQTNLDAGVGYRFFHKKELELIGRVGGGMSREFGGADDRWVPESLFGVEYSQQLNATQKLYGKLDYFPEWDQVGEYRTVADAGWEVVLVQPSNLSLKISANDRYDSTPNGTEPHLVNYSVLLLLKL